jgi:uncharacterized membrane protein YedE/YeeE
MKLNIVGALTGAFAGFVMAWAGLSDPKVIRDMLMLREAHVFLLMGCAMVVAAVGSRLLHRGGWRAFVTREPIGWSTERPALRHVLGSLAFGAGWSVAATCPGPAAVMIGEGRATGLVVASGIVAGVLLQRATDRWRSSAATGARALDVPGVAGL